jgi:hypothetical protein
MPKVTNLPILEPQATKSGQNPLYTFFYSQHHTPHRASTTLTSLGYTSKNKLDLRLFLCSPP